MSSIRFTGAAGAWLECLPLGDGRLGAMTDGGVTRTVVHLNDVGAWSGSPSSEMRDGGPDAAESARLLARARAAVAADDPVGAEAPLQALQTRYAQSFLPLGTATIDVVDAEATTARGPLRRSLDLRTGIHRSTLDAVATSTFVTAEHSVLVHVIDAPLEVEVGLASPLHGAHGDAPDRVFAGSDTALLLRLPSDVAPGHEPDLPAAEWAEGTVQAAIVARVRRESERTVVLIATATTFRGAGRAPAGTAKDALADAVARLDLVSAIDAGSLREDSASASSRRLGTVELRLGPEDVHTEIDTAEIDTAERFARARRDPRGILAADPGLVALLFDYGRYLLVCSSRPGGLPATLQGIWNAEMRPPWGSAYTLNINTEMNYWGAQVTDLASQARPLEDFTTALARAAASQTRRLYDAPGWTVHHNTDAWLYATTPGRGAGDPRWSFWPLGGAWLGSLLTEPWEFGAAGRDDLARVWPTLRAATEFVLVWHRDGTTSLATSPENAFLLDGGGSVSASVVATTTMDTALVRALLRRTVEAARVLGIDDDVAAQASARLASLPSQPAIAANGTILEWDRERPEEDPHHRHVSALYGLFPGDEPWDEAHRAAAATTLDRRGDDSSGWSLIWKLALWARLRRPDRVSAILALALRDARRASGPWAGGLYPNLFAAHPPFQIDANLGFVGALAEALLQSHDGIRLLPAVPEDLADGRVSGLIARPGLVVDIAWQDGCLVEASLRARTARATGEHTVHWGEHTVRVAVGTDHPTVLSPRSFPTQEVHP
ncbi:glycoside hydrolase N-terminal domain-containing protein [Microbacterium sp. NPDC008134]|uniref:glycosyl hydrolase family 95 catalytic domain-containing protein n=1 Tax=Microbacterium sp. NPDC008134 TaxID=3364183 RepID=UPI0036EDD52B